MGIEHTGEYSSMAVEDHKDQGNVANRRKAGSCEPILRILALLLTLTAAVVLGLSKQTAVEKMKVIPTFLSIDVPASLKWLYFSAFVFFVVANAIACAYAAFSLVFWFFNRGTKSLVIVVLDIVMVALLFAGNGAATAIGVMGRQGNTHVQWGKVCNVFDTFCHRVGASILLSLLGSLAFMCLVVLAHNGSN